MKLIWVWKLREDSGTINSWEPKLNVTPQLENQIGNLTYYLFIYLIY